MQLIINLEFILLLLIGCKIEVIAICINNHSDSIKNQFLSM